MVQLRTVGVRLGVIGRGALVGVLVGMLASQAIAEGAVTTQQAPAKPETASVPSGPQTEQTRLATTANLPLASQDSTNGDSAALPDAPGAPPTATTESSSLNMPVDLKAMLDDAKQNAQNVQSAPAQTKHPIHGGWLVLAGVGGLWMGIGLWGLSVSDSKKGPIAGVFVVPGAAMLGGGLYLTFRK
ncbi:MAG TPA: hypothetical protein VMT38_04950 [Terracidiphilus sp.]|nr:hypothetical protein [Terracidiphilus sp.]